MMQYKKFVKYMNVGALRGAFSVVTIALLLFLSLAPVPVFSQAGEDQQARTANSSNCSEGEVEIGVSVPGVEDNCVENGTGDQNPIFIYLRGIIQFLAVGVGIAVTIGIIVGGIQYMTSRGNPQATQAAISRITNAVIALVLFIFMAAIINFLIPGGLL